MARDARGSSRVGGMRPSMRSGPRNPSRWRVRVSSVTLCTRRLSSRVQHPFPGASACVSGATAEAGFPFRGRRGLWVSVVKARAPRLATPRVTSNLQSHDPPDKPPTPPPHHGCAARVLSHGGWPGEPVEGVCVGGGARRAHEWDAPSVGVGWRGVGEVRVAPTGLAACGSPLRGSPLAVALTLRLRSARPQSWSRYGDLPVSSILDTSFSQSTGVV